MKRVAVNQSFAGKSNPVKSRIIFINGTDQVASSFLSQVQPDGSVINRPIRDLRSSEVAIISKQG